MKHRVRRSGSRAQRGSPRLYDEITTSPGFLRSIAEVSADAIATTDLEGRFTYFSPGAEAIFGYRAEEVLGRRIADYYRGGVEEARAVMARLTVEGQIRHYETAFRAKDGRWIELECSSALLRDAQGAVIGTLGVGRDITERKRAEEALRESEALTRGILESALDAVIAIDHRGRILQFNPAAERIFGYSRDQVLGRQMAELIIPPSLRDWHQRGFMRYLTTGESVVLGRRLEFPALRADGTEFPAELTVTRPQGEGPLRFTAYLRDISERKRAEEALRESEERFRRAFEDAAVGMALQGTDGRYLRVNHAFCQMVGYSREELLGMTFVEITYPEDLGADVEAGRRMLAGEIDWYQVEKRYLHKDRTRVVWALIVVSGVRDRDGVLMYDVVQAQDITQRKRDEEHAREFAERLGILREIDLAILVARSPEEITSGGLRHLRRLLPTQRASITVFDFDAGELLHLAVESDRETRLPAGTRRPLGAFPPGLDRLRRGEMVRVDDLEALAQSSSVPETLLVEGIRAAVYIPLIAHGELIGSLDLGAAEPGAFTAAQVQIAREVANSLAVVLDSTRLYEQARRARDRLYALARQLVEVQETERRHLARELHDEVGQTLTALKLMLERAMSGPSAGRLADARQLVDELMARVREMSLDLRPAMLDDFGLLPTLLWDFDRYRSRTGVEVVFTHSGLDRRFPAEAEIATYRIVQEALSNVARHAGVHQAKVRVLADGEELDIQIEDGGAGFDATAALAGAATSGLRGMGERVALLGGRFTVHSTPGSGTRLAATLPLRVEP